MSTIVESGASVWSFAKQTNVMITKSHQEIVNAIRKRELRLSSEPNKKLL